jgi:hypothetical protein
MNAETVIPDCFAKYFEPGPFDFAQQAQECAKAPLDHRCLLDAGYALVVS